MYSGAWPRRRKRANDHDIHTFIPVDFVCVGTEMSIYFSTDFRLMPEFQMVVHMQVKAESLAQSRSQDSIKSQFPARKHTGKHPESVITSKFIIFPAVSPKYTLLRESSKNISRVIVIMITDSYPLGHLGYELGPALSVDNQKLETSVICEMSDCPPAGAGEMKWINERRPVAPSFEFQPHFLT